MLLKTIAVHQWLTALCVRVLVCVCTVQTGDAVGWSEEGECVVLVLGGHVPIY